MLTRRRHLNPRLVLVSSGCLALLIGSNLALGEVNEATDVAKASHEEGESARAQTELPDFRKGVALNAHAELVRHAEDAVRDLSPQAKLSRDAHAVVLLRVESVTRWMSYGVAAIDVKHKWYMVRGQVLSVLKGDLPAEADSIDVLFLAHKDATVFGFKRNPKQSPFAASEPMVRAPHNGKQRKHVDVLAFLIKTTLVAPVNHRLERPVMYVPVGGFEHGPRASFKMVSQPAFVDLKK